MGDRFYLSSQGREHCDWSEEFKELFDDRQVIVEVIGFAINENGEVEYSLQFIEPSGDDYEFLWMMTEDVLESDFIEIGSETSALRFLSLELE